MDIWIIKRKMVASRWPDPEMFEIYKKEEIKVIIDASNYDNHQNIPNGMLYYQIGIPDLSIPFDSQIEKLLEITYAHSTKKEPIVIHCVTGCGRTGLIIAIWAIYNGYIPKNIDPVEWIRDKRKYCIEIKEQIELVRKIAKKYHPNQLN